MNWRDVVGNGFIAGLAIGAIISPLVIFFILRVIGLLCEAIFSPQTFVLTIKKGFAETVFFLTPSDWVWMSGKYKRKQFYEHWRNRTCDLEREISDAGWKRVNDLRERYK